MSEGRGGGGGGVCGRGPVVFLAAEGPICQPALEVTQGARALCTSLGVICLTVGSVCKLHRPFAAPFRPLASPSKGSGGSG